MFRKIIGKLNSQTGESLAETLVALLISAVALVMLAGVMSAAGSVISSSRNKLKAYYEATNEKLVNRSGETAGSNSVTISDSGGTSVISIQYDSITYYKNTVFSQTPIVAYK